LQDCASIAGPIVSSREGIRRRAPSRAQVRLAFRRPRAATRASRSIRAFSRLTPDFGASSPDLRSHAAVLMIWPQAAQAGTARQSAAQAPRVRQS
jgi:hypothetical protein